MLKNGIYNTAAGLIRLGIGILTVPVLIRSLGVEEYGLWTLASTVINIVTLAEAGLSTATTVFVAQDLAKDDVDGLSQTLTVTGGAMLGLATLAALVLWVGAEPIVSSFATLDRFQHIRTVEALQIGGVAVWSSLLKQVLVGVEQAYQRYDLLNLLNTVQSLLNGLGMLAVIWAGGRIVDLMEWQAVTGIVILLAHLWLVFSLVGRNGIRFYWNRARGVTVFRYSLETWFTSIGGVLFTQVDKLIVGSMLGSKELGIYGAITNVTTQINLLSSLPVQPLVPIVSKYLATEGLGGDALKQRVKSALQLNGVVSLGMGMILFSFAPLLLSFLVGKGFTAESVTLFRTATVIYSLYSLNAVGYYLLFGVNQVAICMKINLVSGFFSLLLIYLGAINFSTLGAIVGNIGYLGSLYLITTGLRKVNISMASWLQWLYVPLLWFAIALIMSIFIESNFILTTLFCTFQCILLCVWYFKYSGVTMPRFTAKNRL